MRSLLDCAARTRAVLLAGLAVCTAFGADWTHHAGGANRRAVANASPPNLATVSWHVTPLSNEEFIAMATPIAYGGRVFVAARVFDDGLQVSNALICYSRSDGARLWAAPLPMDYRQSWSSPVAYPAGNVAISCTSYSVTAVDFATGAEAWSVQLPRRVVNASPAVSADLAVSGTPANRLFITEFSPLGSCSVHAINVDPYHAANNPYQPGDIAWTYPFERMVGATPAYQAGLVFVANTVGTVVAINAASGGQAWATSVPGLNCYAGVTVFDGAVYAAGYNFYGGHNNSTLAKLDATTGAIRWTAPCERTDSIPVPLGDGRIALSGGIEGYGSAVKVQLFRDNGGSATLLWDTDVATGGALPIGGWTHQPAVSRGRLCVGRPSPASADFDPYERLYAVDLALSPGTPGFIIAEHVGSGGNPSFAGNCLLSLGQGGLYAFCPVGLPIDGALDPNAPIDAQSADPIEQ
ncbi:MAG: PQQ-like beta-propeller repeat protein [Planctomycetes bacterium]|nr:PQQ-like beta-propeller repeat protein [Planctomycetota bacterium]